MGDALYEQISGVYKIKLVNSITKVHNVLKDTSDIQILKKYHFQCRIGEVNLSTNQSLMNLIMSKKGFYIKSIIATGKGMIDSKYSLLMDVIYSLDLQKEGNRQYFL